MSTVAKNQPEKIQCDAKEKKKVFASMEFLRLLLDFHKSFASQDISNYEFMNVAQYHIRTLSFRLTNGNGDFEMQKV